MSDALRCRSTFRIAYGVLRPVGKSPEQIADHITRYKAAESEFECNCLISEFLKDGAIFVGYLGEGEEKNLPCMLRDADGKLNGSTTEPGDTLFSPDQMTHWRKIETENQNARSADSNVS